MTINLALYFLARLAHKDCSVSYSYAPLDPSLSKPAKYWVPAKDISWNLIRTGVKIYLPGALVERQENGEG